jgi:hypothetical protein
MVDGLKATPHKALRGMHPPDPRANILNHWNEAAGLPTPKKKCPPKPVYIFIKRKENIYMWVKWVRAGYAQYPCGLERVHTPCTVAVR